MPGWKEISEFVLKYDYCCGCGVCTGVCPQNALEMRFNEYGEYKPYLRGNCTACGLCSRVCPFVNGNPNEDEIGRAKFRNIEGIKHTPETGYYLDSYVGYAADPQVRWSGASGGLTTWLLCMLLETRRIDGVITVAPTGRASKLFEYRVLSDPKNVQSCSKSAYYPVELSPALRHIRTNPARYAIVGLPCFLKAVSLACECIPSLQESIVYKAGLVCGQLKSACYSRYLSVMAGNSKAPTSVCFREKSENRPASDFLFQARSCQGESEALGFSDTVGEVWCSGLFQINACGFCDDVFAECADITLMDAWLPEYRDDPKGTNLLLVRNPALAEVVDRARSRGDIVCEPIGIEQIVQSQAGVVRAKRMELAIRLHQQRQVPRKRVPPVRGKLWPVLRMLIRREEVRRSRLLFTGRAEGSLAFRAFEKRLNTLCRRGRMLRAAMQKVQKICSILRLRG
jgi:coenzyme F420 hydrogenase subunit beta